MRYALALIFVLSGAAQAQEACNVSDLSDASIAEVQTVLDLANEIGNIGILMRLRGEAPEKADRLSEIARELVASQTRHSDRLLPLVQDCGSGS